LNNDLDKTLELLKRYQVEENIQHLSEDFNKLAKRQEQLKNKNYKRSESEQQKIEQKSIQNSLDFLKKNFQETLKLNSDLKSPYQIQDLSKDIEDIQQQLDKINQDIGKKSSKKLKQEQQAASDQMKKLSKKMEDMLNEMNSMSMNMNMEDLRQIIENLNEFSFAQEDIYLKLQPTYATDPLYNELMKSQNKLENDFLIIKDSLNSLSTRVVQMSKLINKELKNINYAMQTALSEFEQLHRRAVMRQQRSIMNSTNILALYLDELSDQLQQQMSQSASGKGQKPMPKNSMQQLKQQQKNLKQQLEQLLEELKKSGGKTNGKVNEQIVKTLAEQEIFNKMLKDLQNSKGISPEGMKQLKEIKKMSDKNVNDLINKNITQELLRRNEQIKTRLLEAENAERKREQDKKRESKEGKNERREFPKEIEQFLKQKSEYKETLQKFNLDLNLYYKNLSKEYYQRIK
jgi:ABC-type transporter Mla subunit MlaD